MKNDSIVIKELKNIPSILGNKPLNKLFENCAKQRVWKKGRQIGVGSAGKVYIVTLKNSGDTKQYILKVQPFNSEFKQELSILHHVLGWVHAPKIYDIWTCKNKAYIVQEKLIKNKLNKQQTYKELKRKILPGIHKLNVAYPDVHDENVMMRKGDRKIVLIDYGWALYFKNKHLSTISMKKDKIYNILTENIVRPIKFEDVLVWERLNLEYDYGTTKGYKEAAKRFYEIPDNQFLKNGIEVI